MRRTSRILIVEDEKLIALSLSLMLGKRGFTVETADTVAAALETIGWFQPGMVLLDLWLPDGNGLDLLKRIKSDCNDLPVIVMSANGDADSAVKALKMGAEDFLGKPFTMEVLLHSLDNALDKCRGHRTTGYSRQELRKKTEDEKLVGTSTAMVELFKMIKVCSETDAKTILLLGESGTGKELVARAVHTHSARASAPFIEINCAAIPENLLESELFGHEKGAYTDAGKTRKGVFELAEGGTVFLDEIGDMPLSMQAKVLKIIETKRFRRLGSEQDIQADVRIIAATHQDLPGMVKNRTFRGDLFYRLNVMSICLPPLRERKEDISLLANYFVRTLNAEYGKKIEGISDETLVHLTAYDRPGNVRELRNAIERSVVLEQSATISPHYLNLEIKQPLRQVEQPSILFTPEMKSGNSSDLNRCGVSMNELERHMIRQGLEISGGNQTKAAEYLCISRDTLRYRMKKFGLSSGGRAIKAGNTLIKG
ncbi:sigma-54 dependent transcriptional regulator [Geotalea sp. SG265]|uniref:sigma-54-dependent transcriptional regulator n=1 Tax=Geotalea sp. SG265 TaxID=2922867 RepID=UPI001FAEB232|nr:sigma-54 dependent transcriptional regulator [Geotalea sp. SG265]